MIPSYQRDTADTDVNHSSEVVAVSSSWAASLWMNKKKIAAAAATLMVGVAALLLTDASGTGTRGIVSIPPPFSPDGMLIQDSLLSSSSFDSRSICAKCGSGDLKCNKKCQCDAHVNEYTCNPFRPDVCTSLYTVSDPKTDPLNVANKVSGVLLNVGIGVISEDPLALISTLFSLPASFVSPLANPVYTVDRPFLDHLQRDVKNYVAQEVAASEMKTLYSNIEGNMAIFESVNGHYLNSELALPALDSTITHYLGLYYLYKNNDPWDNALSATSNGGFSGFKGYGLFYSVFVTQMFIAFMQKILFIGVKDTYADQGTLVEYLWKAIKHSQLLVDAYVEQRVTNIEYYLSPHKSTSSNPIDYVITDKRVVTDNMSKDVQKELEKCEWKTTNEVSFEFYHQVGFLSKAIVSLCPQSDKDYIETHSSRCESARKQFVTGTVISNWDTWLIEPSKKWAALADLICKSKSNSPTLTTRCNNQGENSDINYSNGGGKAVDYVTSYNIADSVSGDIVLGTRKTNYCHYQGATHITSRDLCLVAYNRMVQDDPTLVNGVAYKPPSIGWIPGDYPTGCFLSHWNNKVYYNERTEVTGSMKKDAWPICHQSKEYQVQQICQRNNPGKFVIATNISYCHKYYDGTTHCGGDDDENCNSWYSSKDFIDQDSTVYLWTCCVSQSN